MKAKKKKILSIEGFVKDVEESKAALKKEIDKIKSLLFVALNRKSHYKYQNGN